MRTIYKIFIACILTAIVTAFVTARAIESRYEWDYEWDEESEYLCKGDAAPDLNGCCPGETFTDMGDQGFNCCPNDGGDCFPPIKK